MEFIAFFFGVFGLRRLLLLGLWLQSGAPSLKADLVLNSAYPLVLTVSWACFLLFPTMGLIVVVLHSFGEFSWSIPVVASLFLATMVDIALLLYRFQDVLRVRFGGFDPVGSRVAHDFPPDTRSEVLGLLERVTTRSASSTTYRRLSLLEQARGDLTVLRSGVAIHEKDWRDAHEWRPSRLWPFYL